MRRPFFGACLFVVLIVAMLSSQGLVPFFLWDASTPEDSSTIYLTGTVHQVDNNYIYLNKVRYKLTPEGLWQKSSGDVVLPILQISDELLPPQQLVCLATFQAFTHASNPGEFDQADYYAQKGYAGKLRDIRILSVTGSPSRTVSLFTTLREKWHSRLYDIFPEKEASVLSDLLLGIRSELDAETKELFQRGGIAHILSISSLHITLLGMGLFQLLRKLRLPQVVCATSSLLILVAYWLLTGMSLSATRAVLCFALRTLATLINRTYDSLSALGIPAIYLLLSSPASVCSSSFLLSFGCAMGISILPPCFASVHELLFEEDRFYHEPTLLYRLKKRLKKSLSKLISSLEVCLSITLATLPIQLYFFYEIPTYGPLLNLLILPLMPLLMVSGFCAMLLPGLGITGTAAYFVLQIFTGLCKLFSTFPAAFWNPGKPSMWQIILYYLCLAIFLLLLNYLPKLPAFQSRGQIFVPSSHRSKRRFFPCKIKDKVSAPTKFLLPLYSVLLVFLPLLMLCILNVSHIKPSSITFLDVGQGDCIVVTSDEGDIFLFDGGSSSKSSCGKYILKPYLKSMGIQTIKGIFISHMDNDHVNGIYELIENAAFWNLTINNIYVGSAASMDKMRSKYASFFSGSIASLHTISAGDSLLLSSRGNTILQCLHPAKDFVPSDENEASGCFLISFYTDGTMTSQSNSSKGSTPLPIARLLLVGDVQGVGEQALTEQLRRLPEISSRVSSEVSSDENSSIPLILKVAHHGSRYSTYDDFLTTAPPALSIISAGKNNRYGHPHPETLSRLKKYGSHILETSKCGAITIQIHKNQITLFTPFLSTEASP